MVYGNRRSFLNNLTLKWKKIGIFGFLILLFIAVYLINVKVFNTVEKLSAEKLLLMDMLEDALEARLAALEMRAGKSLDAAIEGVNSNTDELTVEARVQVAEVIGAPSMRTALFGIIDGMDLYRQRFNEAAEAQRRLEEERGRIESLSPELDGGLDRLQALAGEAGDGTLTQIAFGIARNVADGKLNAERFLARDAPERLATAREKLSAAIGGLDDLVAAAGDPAKRALADELRARIEALDASIQRAADLTRQREDIFANELDELGPRLVDSLDAVADQRLAGEAGDGTESVQTLGALQQTLFAVSSVAVLLALGACFMLIRAVVTPIRKLTERLAAVAEGETDFEVRSENSLDEMGTMWTALAKLRATVETAYGRAQIIDQLPNPVIVADPNNELRISYVNDSARALFASIRGEHGGGDLVGQPIGVVTGDQREARSVLGDPSRLPWRTRIAYPNGEHVDLKAAAVRGRKGQYVGAMLALRRVTEQVRSTGEFETNIKSTVEQISTTFSGMRSRIETIATSVADAQGRLSEGSEAVTEATASVQMVASAAEELSSSISEIASRLAESTRRATDASNNTADVARRAKELAAVSQRITEVVKTISDIADKTNLLALNATIEAASAGAAGKGFAVVAAEVKNLANQTAKATDEVSQEMAAIQGQIRTVTEGITAVADVIEEINGVFASISAAAEEQQAATREITMNAQHAAGGAETAAKSIRVITDASAGNLQATQDLSRAARELAEANDNLARQSDAFLSSMKKSG